MQGLRTLCLGERTLGKEEYAEWDSRYQQSAGQIEGRDEAMAKAAEEVEKDLELIGCTAIEDKLQQGVASAIQTLLDAGIKVSGMQSSKIMGRLEHPADSYHAPYPPFCAHAGTAGTCQKA